MSYSVVYETKVVRIQNGRVIHFCRSGCNNDNVGRKRDEFIGKIYKEDEFIAYAKSFQKNSYPYSGIGGFDLKIGSRPASWYDYGTHLLRMLKRAEDYSTFVTTRHFHGIRCKAIHITSPEDVVLTPEEFAQKWAEYVYQKGGVLYKRELEYPTFLEDIIPLLEAGEYLQFYISRRIV